MADDSRNILMLPGQSLDDIEWRDIPGIPGYAVSEYGHVKRTTPGHRTWPGRLLKPFRHNYGYPTFKLTINGKHRRFEAHKLVALAYLGPRPARHEVAHRDGNPLNNHWRNLLYCTHRENESHKVLHGSSPQGTRNAMAKLTDDAVREIRRRRASGERLKSIGADFGITFQTVSNIAIGSTWRHVQ